MAAVSQCFTRKLVAYTFTQGWSADEVAPYLLAIDGFVQCDDYKSYSHKVTLDEGTERVLVDPTRRLGCVMHVRRRFHEALKLGDKRAARGVELIGAIYDIERLAKTEGLTPEQRLELRTDWSLPLLDLFDAWVDELVPKCLPKSPLGEALGYAQHQRPYVRRCFTDGRFEIDNGHTERILREPVPRAAPRWCAMDTALGTGALSRGLTTGLEVANRASMAVQPLPDGTTGASGLLRGSVVRSGNHS